MPPSSKPSIEQACFFNGLLSPLLRPSLSYKVAGVTNVHREPSSDRDRRVTDFEFATDVEDALEIHASLRRVRVAEVRASCDALALSAISPATSMSVHAVHSFHRCTCTLTDRAQSLLRWGSSRNDADAGRGPRRAEAG
jgi:hypothetical protein